MTLPERLKDAVERLGRDLGTLHVGRATLGMLTRVQVNGKPLHHVATLSLPDVKTVAVQPWDQTLVKAIDGELQKANLGTVSNDGHVVRLVVPPPTAERRAAFVKTAHIFGENARVDVRKIRHEAMKETLESEDATKRLHKSAQAAISAVEQEITNAVERKVKELQG